tara:strand:- start:1778 stop:1996 length:219 start_codon:yes stop_codon:yes gene_type:complete
MAGYRFETRHHGNHDQLGLAALLEAYANDQWHAGHIDAEQAAEVMLERFVKLVRHDLELIELIAKPVIDGER